MGIVRWRCQTGSWKYIEGRNAEIYGWNYWGIDVQDQGASFFVEERTWYQNGYVLQ